MSNDCHEPWGEGVKGGGREGEEGEGVGPPVRQRAQRRVRERGGGTESVLDNLVELVQKHVPPLGQAALRSLEPRSLGLESSKPSVGPVSL